MNFLKKSYDFDEVIFYYNPGRFHHFYRDLLSDVTKERKGISYITHISEIKP